LSISARLSNAVPKAAPAWPGPVVFPHVEDLSSGGSDHFFDRFAWDTVHLDRRDQHLRLILRDGWAIHDDR
jgi:hypothetical protein